MVFSLTHQNQICLLVVPCWLITDCSVLNISSNTWKTKGNSVLHHVTHILSLTSSNICWRSKKRKVVNLRLYYQYCFYLCRERNIENVVNQWKPSWETTTKESPYSKLQYLRDGKKKIDTEVSYLYRSLLSIKYTCKGLSLNSEKHFPFNWHLCQIYLYHWLYPEISYLSKYMFKYLKEVYFIYSIHMCPFNYF